jgi:hypothetical protein
MPKSDLTNKLIQLYQEAQIKIIEIIQAKEARGNSVQYQKALLTEVTNILKELDRKAGRLAEQVIKEAYNNGVLDVNKILEIEEGLNISFAKIHEEAIKVLIENATDDLFNATSFVGREIRDLLREAGLEAIAEKLATGLTVKQTKDLLIQKLTEQGITAIRDKSGRLISLEAYAAMVARSTTREATNQGTMNQLQNLGHDLVQMSSHSPTCSLCAALQGRVYSISGKDSRFPKLDIAFSGGYANIHPNCQHVITPYIERFNDVSMAIDKSNQPFDIDPRSKSEINKYNEGQKKKRELWKDRKQWEQWKMVLGSNSPSTLSAFRSMKRNNSENYRILKSSYRERLSALMP